jgi:hypothetical protein
VHSPDFWTFVILGLLLKVPILAVLGAIWLAARAQDDRHRPRPVAHASMALCAYCGTHVTIGYDAAAVGETARRIATTTGEATFDVEARLVREHTSGPHRYPALPDSCPDCGERAAWAPIAPLDLGAHHASFVRHG